MLYKMKCIVNSNRGEFVCDGKHFFPFSQNPGFLIQVLFWMFLRRNFQDELKWSPNLFTWCIFWGTYFFNWPYDSALSNIKTLRTPVPFGKI